MILLMYAPHMFFQPYVLPTGLVCICYLYMIKKQLSDCLTMMQCVVEKYASLVVTTLIAFRITSLLVSTLKRHEEMNSGISDV